MTATEFVTNIRSFFDEHYDVLLADGVITQEQINIEKSKLFESSDELTRAKDFIEYHKQHSLKPIIGNTYTPLGVVIYGQWKTLELYTTNSPAILSKITAANDYLITINNTAHRFPNNVNFNTSLGDTLFYNTPLEVAGITQFAILALLGEGWTLYRYVITDTGDRVLIK